jgi:hypothetical protein
MAGERILIVLDESFDDPTTDVPQWARQAVLEAGEVHVIAPYIGSRLSVATDDDAPRRAAAERLQSTVGHLQSVGVEPIATMSPDGPLDALKTYLLEHPIDRVVLAVTAECNWREKGLIDKVREVTTAQVQGLPVISRS